MHHFFLQRREKLKETCSSLNAIGWKRCVELHSTHESVTRGNSQICMLKEPNKIVSIDLRTLEAYRIFERQQAVLLAALKDPEWCDKGLPLLLSPYAALLLPATSTNPQPFTTKTELLALNIYMQFY